MAQTYSKYGRRMMIVHRQTHVTHHIAEDEAGVGEFQMLEEAVEFAAVEGAPGTVKVVSGFRLLSGVVVVQELHKDGAQSQTCAAILKQMKNLTYVITWCFAVVQPEDFFLNQC